MTTETLVKADTEPPLDSAMRTVVRRLVDLLPLWMRLRIKRIAGLARLQRWLVGRYLSGVPFEHTVTAGPARGVRFRITLPGDKAIWTGTYEARLGDALRTAVGPGSVCYDIGGYHGYMTAVLGAAGAGRVFVFEPNPANQDVLTRLAELNPQLPIRLVRCALGDVEGDISFLIMRDGSMGKVSTSGFLTNETPTERISTPIRTIDRLVATGEIAPPTLIKMDIEGAELSALRGAVATLRAYHPLLFIEVHTRELMRDCGVLLRDIGYELRDLDSAYGEHDWPRHVVATSTARRTA